MVSMCRRVRTPELFKHVGERVTLAGWLHARRTLGGVAFYLVRDGWGMCQVVCEGDSKPPEIPVESIVRVEGLLVREEKAPGGFELRDPRWHIEQPAEPPPFTLGKRELKLSSPMALDFAPIVLRYPARRALHRLSALVMESFRKTLRSLAFTEISTPKIIGSASEGGADPFALDYFGKRAYLAQSPQLYKQMMVGVFERVFEVGPVFRAEPHDTSRHLNQYTSLDAEMGFIDDHKDVMKVVEKVVGDMVAACTDEREGGEGREQVKRPLLVHPIPQISFWKAGRILAGETGRTKVDLDLSPQDERILGEWARREFQSDFLFVTGYPLEKRPFYTHPDPDRPAYSNSFDLLFRGLEIVTGGQRLHRYDDYVEAMAARGLDQSLFEGYLMAFRHGMPRHGGFAMGLERFVAQLTGRSNVREAALFPRTMGRLAP